MQHLSHIQVTDPATHADSMQVQQWVTYTVSSDAGSVSRRYSDFTWLSDILNISIPGCIIPALPPKQQLGRFVNEFIQARRRGLERYLHRLAEHPDLSQSDFLKSFMTADDATFKRCVNDSQSLKPKTLKLFQDSLKSKWNTYVVTGKPVELEKDAGSIAVDEMLNYILKVDSIMNNMVKSTESMTEKSRKSSQSLHDFGLGFVSYGEVEGDVLGQMMSRVGKVIDQLAVTAGDHASAEIQTLLEPLSEYGRAMESVKTSISVRSDRRLQYIHILTQIDALNVQYAKVAGVPGKEAAAAKKEQEIDAEQKNANNIKAEFDLITSRLLRDFAEFQSRKCREMKSILLAFVDLQCNYHRQSIAAWDAVTPILNSTEFPERGAWETVPTHSAAASIGNANTGWREAGSGQQASIQPPKAPTEERMGDSWSAGERQTNKYEDVETVGI
jgi:sorting nexin-1/2